MTVAPSAPRSASSTPGPGQQVALVDLLDRVLAGGVVISGEIVIGIADVNLVRISLRALVASVSTCQDDPTPGPSSGAEDVR